MKTKLSILEKYRIDSESEVEEFLEDMKKDAATKGYLLDAYSSKKKEKKSKGTVIDEAYEVTVTKKYSEFWIGDLD